MLHIIQVFIRQDQWTKEEHRATPYTSKLTTWPEELVSPSGYLEDGILHLPDDLAALPVLQHRQVIGLVDFINKPRLIMLHTGVSTANRLFPRLLYHDQGHLRVGELTLQHKADFKMRLWHETYLNRVKRQPYDIGTLPMDGQAVHVHYNERYSGELPWWYMDTGLVIHYLGEAKAIEVASKASVLKKIPLDGAREIEDRKELF